MIVNGFVFTADGFGRVRKKPPEPEKVSVFSVYRRFIIPAKLKLLIDQVIRTIKYRESIQWLSRNMMGTTSSIVLSVELPSWLCTPRTMFTLLYAPKHAVRMRSTKSR